MKKIYIQNLIKNIILLILLMFSYFEVTKFFSEVNVENNSGDMLVAVSIIAVIACFGNFAFTYEKTLKHKKSSILLVHLTTGLLMFIVGISVIMGADLTGYLVGQHYLIQGTWYLLYLASILYDFWDLERVFIK